jgi:hypothetical protein
MLQTLDVLIGFALVMLIVSMAVTMITQFIGSSLLNLRGTSLRIGLTRLMALMDAGLKTQDAKRIIDHILRNPLIGGARLIGNARDLATIVHREELTKLILDFAVPGDAEKANEPEMPGEQSLRNKLRASLKRNGIPDPADVLKKVRDEVLKLEQSHPHLSNSARVNMALLKFADSDYLSKFNSWFDQTVDRVSDLFTKRVWVVTALVSLVLAFVVQLDSIGLLNRLSVDPALRNQLVAMALNDPESRDPAKLTAAPGGGTATAGTPDANSASEAGNEAAAAGAAGNETKDAANAAADTVDAANSAADAGGAANTQTPNADTGTQAKTVRQLATQINESGFSDLGELGLVSIPRNFNAWAARWKKPPQGRLPFFFGILLSAALLSLGAPFWYSVLANLVKLRSVTSRKEETERTERQTNQTIVAPTT